MMKPPSPSFIRGFLFTAAVLFSLNLASYVLLKRRMALPLNGARFGGGNAGFPLPFYEVSFGSIIGFDGFVTSGVVLDYLFVLGVAMAVGVCCHRLSRKRRY